MRWSNIETIPCPVAQAMAVIGDAWTILILRDAIRGTTRFEEFQQSTRAPRATLTDRLAHLVEHSVLKRVQYEAHPPRYEYKLTSRGESLKPVMMVLAHWGETHLPAKVRPSTRRHTGCGHKFKPVVHCSECGEAIAPGTVTFEKPFIPTAAKQLVEGRAAGGRLRRHT